MRWIWYLIGARLMNSYTALSLLYVYIIVFTAIVVRFFCLFLARSHAGSRMFQGQLQTVPKDIFISRSASVFDASEVSIRECAV